MVNVGGKVMAFIMAFAFDDPTGGSALLLQSLNPRQHFLLPAVTQLMQARLDLL